MKYLMVFRGMTYFNSVFGGMRLRIQQALTVMLYRDQVYYFSKNLVKCQTREGKQNVDTMFDIHLDNTDLKY